MANDSSPVILMAEDDHDDRILNKDALEEAGLSGKIHFVSDGVELIDYLYQRAGFGDRVPAPQPELILLDLKMPRKNGLEALEEIKADPRLQGIPVFILTTSNNEDDIQHARELGANGYFTKPVTFNGLVEVMRKIGRYWKEKGAPA